MNSEEFTEAAVLVVKGIDPDITGMNIHWIDEICATAAIIHYRSGRDRMVDLYPIVSQLSMLLTIIGKVLDIRKENHVSKD